MSLKAITFFTRVPSVSSVQSRSISNVRKTNKTTQSNNILNVTNKKDLYKITEPKEMDPELTASKPNSLGEKFPPGSWWADETNFDTGFEVPKKTRISKRKKL